MKSLFEEFEVLKVKDNQKELKKDIKNTLMSKTTYMEIMKYSIIKVEKKIMDEEKKENIF